jgi:hypothetical protein
MNFLEKDLEDIIFTTPSESLEKVGLSIRGKRLRQLKIGNYGIADLVTFQKPVYSLKSKTHWEGTITIYELKKNEINISTLMQCARYLTGIKSYMKSRGLVGYEYKIVLIGREFNMNGEFPYLHDILADFDLLECYEYSYQFNGINFEQILTGHKLMHEGF